MRLYWTHTVCAEMIHCSIWSSSFCQFMPNITLWMLCRMLLSHQYSRITFFALEMHYFVNSVHLSLHASPCQIVAPLRSLLHLFKILYQINIKQICSVLSEQTWVLFFPSLLFRTTSVDDTFAHCMILVLCSILRFRTLRTFFKKNSSFFVCCKGWITFLVCLWTGLCINQHWSLLALCCWIEGSCLAVCVSGIIFHSSHWLSLFLSVCLSLCFSVWIVK